MSISTILNGATAAQDADSAHVFAEILNNDLRAIQTLAGRNRFESEDALRISRIWAEYQGMDKSKASFRPRGQPNVRPSAAEPASI